MSISLSGMPVKWKLAERELSCSKN
jgi:hypothetical protein